LGFADDKDDDRQRGPAPRRYGRGDSAKSSRKRAASPELGHALRSVYQRTIDEDIPPEMLDLLGKLG
jgi:hypothetical protein